MTVISYVTILEDLLLGLQINVAVAKGFQELERPDAKGENTKKYIDLWPIQMSAEIAAEGDAKQNVLTTNFDTCRFLNSYLIVKTNLSSLRYLDFAAWGDFKYRPSLEEGLQIKSGCLCGV